MSVVRVPDIPGPVRPLCWRQAPHAMVRCNREQHGTDVPHTWELEAKIQQLILEADLVRARTFAATVDSTLCRKLIECRDELAEARAEVQQLRAGRRC